MGQLFQEGADYANNLETLTLKALGALDILVSASHEVRQVVIRSRWGAAYTPRGHIGTTNTSSSTVETDADKEKVRNMKVMDNRLSLADCGSSKLCLFVYLSVNPAFKAYLLCYGSDFDET